MEQLVEMEGPQEETEAEIIHRQETEGLDTYVIKEPEPGKHYSQCLFGDDVVDIVGNRHAYRKDEVLLRYTSGRLRWVIVDDIRRDLPMAVAEYVRDNIYGKFTSLAI